MNKARKPPPLLPEKPFSIFGPYGSFIIKEEEEAPVLEQTIISNNTLREDLEIREYIQSSPIVSEFRLKNPNLQPIESSDHKHNEAPSVPRSGISSTSTLSQSDYQSFNRSKSTYRLNEAKKYNPLENDSVSIKKKKRFSMNDIIHSKKSHRLSTQFKNLKISSSNSPVISSMASPPESITSRSSQSTLSTFKAGVHDGPGLKHTISGSSAKVDKSNFWKYHVLKFGKDLYLTTNPDLKHVYCRNGPGYYVEVTVPKDVGNTRASNSEKGFKLVFKDINDYNDIPVMTIIKSNKAAGGNIRISLRKKTYLDVDGTLKSIDTEKRMIFDGVALEKSMKTEQLIDVTDYENYNFMNFECRDFHNHDWKVGSIPKIKQTNRAKLMSRLDLSTDESFKYAGKKNIFFYDPVLENHILALFRPNETRTKKKIIQSVNRNGNLASSRVEEEDLDLSLGARSYYKTGDGLYQQNPADDAPNNHKLGWITLYEDEKVLNNIGMFDYCLGMTLAIGFAKVIDEMSI